MTSSEIPSRTAHTSRRTTETEVTLRLNLDGAGQHEIATGIGFLDHMLAHLAVHGLFDLTLKATGDLQVDPHHTVEDVALTLGQAFEEALAGKLRYRGLTQVFDVAHNIGKVERHTMDGRQAKLVVHRKGATRAFGPRSKDLPRAYHGVGQPVLIPGSMGTPSYILVGTDKALDLTFGSCCHGAGRVLSRKQAKRQIWGEDLVREMRGKGITIQTGSLSGLAEEAPAAYKDVERVVDVVTTAGLARKVARLVPIGVIKG